MDEEKRKKKREYNQRYYAKNQDKILVQKAGYYQDNIEERRLYRAKNKDRDKVYQTAYDLSRRDKRAQYYQDNKAHISVSQKVYRKNNPDKVKETTKKCQQKGKDKKREQVKARRHSNPMVALIHNIRGTVSNSFKRKGWGKNTKTHKIIGCDFNDLHNHLVLSAIKTYGIYIEGYAYHIDHIIPIATAKTEEEVIALNHYTNLQYLLPEDNMKKGSKLNWALNKK